MTKTGKLTRAAAMTVCLVMASPVLAAVGGQAPSAAAPRQDHSIPRSFAVAEVKADAHATAGTASAGHAEAGHQGGEHGGGFPPFNPKHFISQLVWLVISFGALYFLMSRATLPRIGRILEERRQRISRDLEEAALRRSESEAAQAAYEKALTEARGKANTIAGEARNRLTAESDTNRKSLEAALAAKLEDAERRIAATKSEAMSHVRGIAIDAAQAIVTTLVGTTPQGGDLEHAVDGALSRKAGA